MLPEIRQRFEAATGKAKQIAIAGIVAKDLFSAVVPGSIFLLLAGTALGLSSYIHPALAAVVTGALCLLVVGITAFIAAKSRKKD